MKRQTVLLPVLILASLLLIACGSAGIDEKTEQTQSVQIEISDKNAQLSEAEAQFLAQYLQSLKNEQKPKSISVSGSVSEKWESLRGGDTESVFVTDVFYRDDSETYMALLQEYTEKVADGTDFWYHVIHLSCSEKGVYTVEDDVLTDYYQHEGKEETAELIREAFIKYRQKNPVSALDMKDRKNIALWELATRLELTEEETEELLTWLDVVYDEKTEEEFLPGVLMTDSSLLDRNIMVESYTPVQEDWLDSVCFRIGYRDSDDPWVQEMISRLFGDAEYYDVFATKTGDSLNAHIVLFYDYGN